MRQWHCGCGRCAQCGDQSSSNIDRWAFANAIQNQYARRQDYAHVNANPDVHSDRNCHADEHVNLHRDPDEQCYGHVKPH